MHWKFSAASTYSLPAFLYAVSLVCCMHVCLLLLVASCYVLLYDAGKEVMWLKNRLGFVRLALMYGAPLVPAFVFGQSKTYS